MEDLPAAPGVSVRPSFGIAIRSPGLRRTRPRQFPYGLGSANAPLLKMPVDKMWAGSLHFLSRVILGLGFHSGASPECCVLGTGSIAPLPGDSRQTVLQGFPTTSRGSVDSFFRGAGKYSKLADHALDRQSPAPAELVQGQILSTQPAVRGVSDTDRG